MECLFSFSVLIAIMIVLICLASQAQSRADRWTRAYQALAQHYGGTFFPAGWFSRPSARFTYGATYVLVSPQTTGRPGDFTEIRIQWPDQRLRLEVFTQWNDDQLLRCRDMQDVATGAKDFDTVYVIRGNSSADVRSFLSDGVRWQIERLSHFFGDQHITLSIHRGWILIKKWKLTRRYEHLQEFTRLALELYDQAMLTRNVGIAFVEDQSVQVIQEAICQICGENIMTEMVFCYRCKTPHHVECWQYYGSCAVYGCCEKQYVTPRLAGPATDS